MTFLDSTVWLLYIVNNYKVSRNFLKFVKYLVKNQLEQILNLFFLRGREKWALWLESPSGFYLGSDTRAPGCVTPVMSLILQRCWKVWNGCCNGRQVGRDPPLWGVEAPAGPHSEMSRLWSSESGYLRHRGWGAAWLLVVTLLGVSEPMLSDWAACQNPWWALGPYCIHPLPISCSGIYVQFGISYGNGI